MSINLLPWRETKNKAQTTYLIIGLIAYAILIGITMLITKNIFIQKTRQIDNHISIIQQEIQQTHASNSQQNVKLLNTLNSTAAQKLVSIKINNQISNLLIHIANDIPAQVTLTSLTLNKNKLIITGASQQLSDIRQYHLRLQKNFPSTQILLTEMHADNQQSLQMDFTMQVTL